jgi:hypothetical protein
MANTSHANAQQTVAAANPPTLGVQDLPSFVDEIFVRIFTISLVSSIPLLSPPWIDIYL